MLPNGEKECPPRKPLAAREVHAFEHAFASFEAHDPFFADDDAVAGEFEPLVVLELGRSIGAKDEVTGPTEQLERQSMSACPASVHGNRLAAQLPRIAERAVKHTAA